MKVLYLREMLGKTFVRVAALVLMCPLVVAAVPSAAYADSKYASLVIDGETGVVLHQENAGQYRYPASLTKMMTLYLTFQALERGKLRMGQSLRVSSRAAAQPPSKIRLRQGSSIKVKDAIMAAIVKSANDATVVLAEGVAGSEWQFSLMMNRMAKKLGMNHTNFRNATGLHDARQKTTAYDMARLAVALKRDYGKYYHLFGRNKFFYNGQTYVSHNNVTRKYYGADGLKTGYIRASGYNLVTSAHRGGSSVVGVVMGGRTSQTRDRHMVKLLDQAFYKVARGNIGRERLYTGVTPVPELKPGASQEYAQEDTPEPKLRPRSALKVASSGFPVGGSRVPFASVKAISANRVLVDNEFVPIPLLKPDYKSLLTASLGVNEQGADGSVGN